MKQFFCMLFGFTLPFVFVMPIIGGAQNWWGIDILSEDLNHLIQQNLQTWDTIRVITIALFSLSFAVILFYKDKEPKNKLNDTNKEHN